MIFSAKFLLRNYDHDFKEEDVLSFLSDAGRICKTDPLWFSGPQGEVNILNHYLFFYLFFVNIFKQSLMKRYVGITENSCEVYLSN